MSFRFSVRSHIPTTNRPSPPVTHAKSSFMPVSISPTLLRSRCRTANSTADSVPVDPQETKARVQVITIPLRFIMKLHHSGLFMRCEAAPAHVALPHCPIYNLCIRYLPRRTFPWVNPILAPVHSVSLGSGGDQRALELRDASEDGEHHAPGRRRRIGPRLRNGLKSSVFSPRSFSRCATARTWSARNGRDEWRRRRHRCVAPVSRRSSWGRFLRVPEVFSSSSNSDQDFCNASCQ